MSIPAVCSVCQSIATAHYDLSHRDDTFSIAGDSLSWETRMSAIDPSFNYLMDEHDILDNSGVNYGRCDGSFTTPQTINIKRS
jgi:hypothetical protein